MQIHPIIKRISIIAFIAVIVLSPIASHAQGLLDAFGQTNSAFDSKCGLTDIAGCIQWLAEFIGMLIGFIPAMIASAVIGWGAELINFMIDISRDLMNLDKNILLSTGFGIALDLANLGFVLAIIVIAFATILRQESYALKQTLWKLIAAALLVNFSLPLVGLIVDFTNVLAYFFIDQASGGGATLANFNAFTNNILAAFQPQRSFIPADGLQAGFGAFLALLVTPIMISIFSAITAIVMVTFGIMLLVRYVYLEILLILMPLAWLMWIFPTLAGMWKDWWRQFLKWTFFLPAATFFIYLALISVSQIGGLIDERATDPQIAQAVSTVTVMKDSIALFLRMAIMSGLMLGGLIAASSIGIKSADMGMGWAKGLRGWATGVAGRVGARAASAPLRAEWGRNLTAGLQKIPLLRGVGTGLANLRIASEKNILKPYEQEIKGLSLEEMARRYSGAAKPLKMLILQKLAQNRKLDLIKMEENVAKDMLENLQKGYGQHETTPRKKSAQQLAKQLLEEEGEAPTPSSEKKT